MCEHKDIWTGESESASFHCFITPALKLSTNLFAKACKGPPLPSPSAIELAGAGFNGQCSAALSSRGGEGEDPHSTFIVPRCIKKIEAVDEGCNQARSGSQGLSHWR